MTAYYDDKLKRLLLTDGTSVMEPFDFIRADMSGKLKENTKVTKGYDSDSFESKYQIDIGFDMDGELPEVEPMSHEHTEEEYRRLIDLTLRSRRRGISADDAERFTAELDYFERTNNIKFLLKLVDMIEQFKQNGVVWGVGRGSACSSYILYLLEVHDIDPLKYDLPFSEFSKEQDY